VVDSSIVISNRAARGGVVHIERRGGPWACHGALLFVRSGRIAGHVDCDVDTKKASRRVPEAFAAKKRQQKSLPISTGGLLYYMVESRCWVFNTIVPL
jgi:hypothetical protein